MVQSIMSVTSYTSEKQMVQQYEVTAIIADNLLTIRQLDNPNGGGLKSALADGTDVRRRWKYYDLFDGAPNTSTYATDKGTLSDEMHIVVHDKTGGITGFDSDLGWTKR